MDSLLQLASDPSAWAANQAPRLLGEHDDPTPLASLLDAGGNRLLIELHRRNPHLRVGATDLVGEQLLPVVLEQKVTGAEAFRAGRLLVQRFGDMAPGPASVPGHVAHGMRLPLSARQWAQVPSWEFLQAGVEQKRSATLVAAARRGSALERILEHPDPDAALRSLPGIGPWTSAMTRHVAHGDPDAWSVGDYHVPGMIGRVLLGRPPADDAEVEHALEPYRGHRYRVEMLVLRSRQAGERHGARRSLPTHLPVRHGTSPSYRGGGAR